jgi:hypothetical protein
MLPDIPSHIRTGADSARRNAARLCRTSVIMMLTVFIALIDKEAGQGPAREQHP